MQSTIKISLRFEIRILGWLALIVLGGIVGSAGVSSGQQSAQRTAQQAKVAMDSAKKDPVKRLQPADVAATLNASVFFDRDRDGMPKEFVEKLNGKGCTVPQFDSTDNPATGADGVPAVPNNVIFGEFARKGQEDWAALCSNGKTSTIVIFWGRPTSCPASLARLDDAHYLKPGRDKKLHYSRSIRPLGEGDLDDRAGLAGLRPLKHEGIDDRFVGKSSAFFYCDAGKWRIFPAKESSSQ
jgi:hypothetical protein